MANNLTVNGLRAKWGVKDLWRSNGGVRGGGRLVARIMQEGVPVNFAAAMFELRVFGCG